MKEFLQELLQAKSKINQKEENSQALTQEDFAILLLNSLFEEDQNEQ